MEKIKHYAKTNGYDDAVYRGKWGVYNVYEPVMDGEQGACVGLPYFILASKTELRMCEQAECLKILRAVRNQSK